MVGAEWNVGLDWLAGQTYNPRMRFISTRKEKGIAAIDSRGVEGLPQDIQVESLGPVLFKGKQQPIHTFAVKPD